MNYAEKTKALIEKHNGMMAEADRLIERVKSLRNASVSIRGQLALIDEIQEEEAGDGDADNESAG